MASAGGAAFLDIVLGGSNISCLALVSFFLGSFPVGSSFANLFCWVSGSIICIDGMALGTVIILGGGCLRVVLLFT
jgi:hypothetical protein